MQMCASYVDTIILYIPSNTSLHTRYVLVAVEGFENNVYTATQHIYTIQPVATCQYYYITAPYSEYTEQKNTVLINEIPSNEVRTDYSIDTPQIHTEPIEILEQDTLPDKETNIVEKEEKNAILTPPTPSAVVLQKKTYYTLTAEEAIHMQEPQSLETRIVGTHTESVELLGNWVQVSQKPVYKNGTYYRHFIATHNDTSTPVYFATPISIDTQHIAVKN